MPQKSASPAPRLKAWLIPLAGHSLPADELTVPFVKAGFECHKRSLSDLGGDDSENSALLFWVGDDWERGFAAVEQWTEELRSATVLVGKRQGGGGLIRQVVEIGALAAVAFPVPGWFPTPLAAALGRLGNPSARRLREELDSLQKAVAEGREPQDIPDRRAHTPPGRGRASGGSNPRSRSRRIGPQACRRCPRDRSQCRRTTGA